MTRGHEDVRDEYTVDVRRWREFNSVLRLQIRVHRAHVKAAQRIRRIGVFDPDGDTRTDETLWLLFSVEHQHSDGGTDGRT